MRALAIALAENSAPAGRLVGSKIVHPPAIDVGFAVEAEDGVLVPVLRDADKRPLAELLGRYNELVELARQRKLPADATGGSIATVTNFGTFGLTWATPIPLARTNAGVGHGRRQTRAELGRGEATIRSGDGMQFDAELRSSRARWRRRGKIVGAYFGVVARAGETLASLTRPPVAGAGTNSLIARVTGSIVAFLTRSIFDLIFFKNMSATLEQIELDALALSPRERADLVGKLWESLDYTPYPALSQEWQVEIERRRSEVREGKVTPIRGEEVSRKARELVKQATEPK